MTTLTSEPQPATPSVADDPASGLTGGEARDRLAASGPNEVRSVAHRGVGRQIVHVFASPLILLLFGASVISAVVGARTDAIIIAVTVTLGAALDVVQLIRSDGAVERLRRSVVTTATVRRDGRWTEIAGREVVVGDVLRLDPGDLVAADARLLAATDLSVQQAAVTGESLPVEKRAAADTPERSRIDADDPAVVLFGSSVVSGSGVARVAATGVHTVYGDIAARLGVDPPPTELERGLRRFGALLARTIVALAIMLAFVSIARHRDPVESLLFAVALAVGIVPEFMPMIMSITLAAGATRMARRRVIVKHLGAIQNVGSVDILCSDKTGTLTAGRMAVEQARGPNGDPCDAVLRLGATAAHLSAGISNPLDETIRAAAPPGGRVEKLGEVPFDFERRRASVAASLDGRRLLIVKGAPESVLPLCGSVRGASGPQPLADAGRREIEARIAAESAQGMRVVAVASRDLPDAAPVRRELETDLTFEGWLALADPVRPDAAATVAALARDGVAIKVITGDNELVARHVCAASGIPVATAIQGAALDSITDAALGAVAERTTLFARVSPRQKLRILLALKARGHVVGFLGDGVNDAPALHAADVGISVSGAADVARDAAEIILLDRDLSSLHAGILEGRRAFGNLMKYLLMATSSNFGNMLSMAVASLVVPFLPLLPTQILLNNFLYDLSQLAIPSDRVDEAFTRKPHHWDIGLLRRFMLRAGLVSSVFDVATFAYLLGVVHAGPALFRTGWFVESMLTQTLVLLVVRTSSGALRTAPSRAVVMSVLAVSVAAVGLPYSPLSGVLGFIRPPVGVLLFVLLTTAGYLGAMEFAKRQILRDFVEGVAYPGAPHSPAGIADTRTAALPQ